MLAYSKNIDTLKTLQNRQQLYTITREKKLKSDKKNTGDWAINL